MSSQTVAQGVDERSAEEYMILGANVLYGIAGLLFLAGLYVDWREPGKVYIQELVITTGSVSNSGLFILAIIFLVVGFAISKVGRFIQARNVEKVDQTQEWTVDVGSNKR